MADGLTELRKHAQVYKNIQGDPLLETKDIVKTNGKNIRDNFYADIDTWDNVSSFESFVWNIVNRYEFRGADLSKFDGNELGHVVDKDNLASSLHDNSNELFKIGSLKIKTNSAYFKNELDEIAAKPDTIKLERLKATF